MVLQVLVESRCLACLMVAFCEVGCVASGVGIEAGGEFEVAVLLVEVGGDRVAPGGRSSSTSASAASPGRRAVGPADRDGPVEPDDRRVGEAGRSSSYHSTIWTQSVSATRGAVRARSAAIAACAWYSPSRSRAQRSRGSMPGSLGDERCVPLAAVLVGERRRWCRPVGCGWLAAGLVEQHQGEQAVDLGVVDQGSQLPGRDGSPRRRPWGRRATRLPKRRAPGSAPLGRRPRPSRSLRRDGRGRSGPVGRAGVARRRPPSLGDGGRLGEERSDLQPFVDRFAAGTRCPRQLTGEVDGSPRSCRRRSPSIPRSGLSFRRTGRRSPADAPRRRSGPTRRRATTLVRR